MLALELIINGFSLGLVQFIGWMSGSHEARGYVQIMSLS